MMVQQAITNPLGINVFGSATIRVEPDMATLNFGVSSVEETPEGVFRSTRSMAQKVQSYLNEAGIQEVSTSRIHLDTQYDHIGGRREFVGYSARIMFTVILEDLDGLEEVLVGVVEAGANIIQNTVFRTSRLRELRIEARQQAVEAARTKAEHYCSAAGVTLGDVLHIEDVNPEILRGHESNAFTNARLDDETSPRAFSPGSIEVGGAVMMTFSLG